MLCLTCSHDNGPLDPQCSACQAWLGLGADNQGYLPQLEVLAHELEEGTVSAEQARERLQRLDQALLFMLSHLRETGQHLATLGLDRGLQPVREGLERLREVAAALPAAGPWSEEHWEQLRQAQHQIVAAHPGLLQVAQEVAQLSEE